MMRKFLAVGAAMLLLSLPVQACAEDETGDGLPSLELLEFLGEFEDEDTGWVDFVTTLETTDGEQDNDTTQEAEDEQ